MEINKISASSYKTWNNCEMSYFIGQNLNWRFPSGKGAALGSTVHKVLEFFARIKLAQQNKQDKIQLDIGEISTSNLDLDSIIDDTYKWYTTQDSMKHINWEKSEYKNYKNYVNIALTHNGGQFNPLNQEIIAIEQYINISLDEPWAILPDGSKLRITGIIDLIVKTDEKSYQIIDWKTNKAMTDFFTGEEITYDYLQKDIQLMLYSLVAPKLYGQDKFFTATMFYLKHKKPISVSFSDKQLQETYKKIKNRFIEIDKCTFPKLNRSWRCKVTCDYGKNTFENTSIKPEIQFLDGGIAQVGQFCKICDQVSLRINQHGLSWTISNLKNN